MTFRDLLEQLEMMATAEPSLLNKDVICSLQNEEYFFVNMVTVEDTGNQYVDKYQPVLVMDL
jgi:hypothetical protein